MNSIVIFFLLVSDKEKLSPNCSWHCTLIGIENENRLINHLLRIKTGEEESTFWKNISGFTLMLILEEFKECAGILCEEGKGGFISCIIELFHISFSKVIGINYN